MTDHVVRARLLMSQGRFEGALSELQQQLGQDPEDAEATALLSLCLGESHKADEALSLAKRAVSLAPDVPFGHYVLGHALLEKKRYRDAATAADQAIGLDPFDPDLFFLKCQAMFSQQQWQAALAAAELGLALDAEHTGCLNGRVRALVQLGRKSEAEQTAAAALHRNPDAAFTHANQGWTLLNSGQWKTAREHFVEALRLNPELEWARQGLIESIKSRNVLYRWVLYYSFAMSRLSPRTQILLIIGGMLGFWQLSNLADAQPQLAVAIWPVLILYGVFVYLVWVAQPLGDLFLRVHPLGRLALSADQRSGANIVGACYLVSAAAVALWLTGVLPHAGDAGLRFFALVIPASAVFRCAAGGRRWTMAAATAGLAIAAALPVVLDFPSTVNLLDRLGPLRELALLGLGRFWLGLGLSTWLANGLLASNDR